MRQGLQDVGGAVIGGPAHGGEDGLEVGCLVMLLGGQRDPNQPLSRLKSVAISTELTTQQTLFKRERKQGLHDILAGTLVWNQ